MSRLNNLPYPKNLAVDICKNDTAEIQCDDVCLNKALARLNMYEELFIKKRYQEHKKYKEIGETFDVSSTRVHHVLRSALYKLGSPMFRKILCISDVHQVKEM